MAGDKLITTSFPGTTTGGFAAVNEPAVAVCLLPGTELAFERHAAWRRSFFGLFQKQRPRGKLARIRQVNTEYAKIHHNAIEFPDGTIVLLTELRPGQRAIVLQLPAAAQMGRDDGATKIQPDVPAADVVPTRTHLFEQT
jgi:hypothetical protein